MLSSPFSIVSLTVLSIIYATHAENAAVFSKEGRIDQILLPLKLKDQTLFTYFRDNDTVLTSFEPGFEECSIPGILPPDRYTLGNGKVVAMTYLHSHFTILDYTNCSTYSTIPVDGGKPYAWDDNKEIELVVPYEDTFDIFDEHGDECMPCRYNDKAEKVESKNKYTREEHWHRDYFLEPIKNADGVTGKYLYGFNYNNETAVVRILDLEFKSLKEKPLGGMIIGHSSFNESAIICYELRDSAKCEKLDADLNTITTSNMHHPYSNMMTPTFKITKLPSGEVMVALKYINMDIGRDNIYNIFIQQIHPDGKVEPVIDYGTFTTSNFVGIYDFVSNSGEYCLVTADDRKGNGNNSLLKCVVPKASELDEGEKKD